MEENYAVQFVAFHDSPTSTLSVIHLIIALPSPLNGRLGICRQTAIHISADVAELETTTVLVSEFDGTLDFSVDKILVPLGHRGDVPASGEWRAWFSFCFCHWSVPQLLPDNSLFTASRSNASRSNFPRH